MTLRGFLACYLGAVVIVGGVGASAYQGLQRRHAAMEAVVAPKPVAVAEATPANTPARLPPAAVVAPPRPAPIAAAAPPIARPLPKLRPHVATAVATSPKPWPRVAVTHAPTRQVPRVVRNEPPTYQPGPYGPPPEMPYGYYASPAYYPYGGYGYYPPRYGYYRSY